MTKQLKDVSKSVHTRLVNLAKNTGRPFADLFRLYTMERFLYRLSKSRHASTFVLKGGLLLGVWNSSLVRPTKDIDLLGRTENSIENLVRIVREICDQAVQPDGLRFEPTSVIGTLIKEDAEYNGVRTRFLCYLGRAEATMQLDVGFGDTVIPPPEEVEVPTLLEFPAPKLRVYQRETTIAEKLHAMVILGAVNGRMKDFYDLWLLSRNFVFKRARLRAAIEATFATRNTPLERLPIALTPAFAADAQPRWSAFVKKSGLKDAPAALSEAVEAVAMFLEPILADTGSGDWPPGGPWS